MDSVESPEYGWVCAKIRPGSARRIIAEFHISPVFDVVRIDVEDFLSPELTLTQCSCKFPYLLLHLRKRSSVWVLLEENIPQVLAFLTSPSSGSERKLLWISEEQIAPFQALLNRATIPPQEGEHILVTTGLFAGVEGLILRSLPDDLLEVSLFTGNGKRRTECLPANSVVVYHPLYSILWDED